MTIDNAFNVSLKQMFTQFSFFVFFDKVKSKKPVQSLSFPIEFSDKLLKAKAREFLSENAVRHSKNIYTKK